MSEVSFLDHQPRKFLNRILAVGLLIFCVFFAYWCIWVPGVSFQGPAAQPSVEEKIVQVELAKHVAAIGSKPHNIQHYQQLNEAADYIEQELNKIGVKVQSQHFVVDGLQVRNIEVIVPSNVKNAPTLVVGAHYDSAGSAPGANDNGSGTSALLVLAKQLESKHIQSKINLRLVFFVNEEPPYFQTDEMGSLVYARMLHQKGVRVAGMLSLETMGYFKAGPGTQNYPFPLSLAYPDEGNFIAFVGMLSSRTFLHKTIRAFRNKAKIPSVGGVAPGFISGIDWSDHWAFAQYGYPAVMVTDTAPFRYPHYHELSDTPDKIDLRNLTRVVVGLESMLLTWMREGFS